MTREILATDGFELAFDPALGGAILSLTHDGRNLLRPTPAGAVDALQTGCFALVPYANRIAHGRFAFGGRTAGLAPNMAGQPHPLHGDGWRGAWTLEANDGASAVLGLEPQGSAWPWRYRARQAMRLDAAGLTLELSVTNLDDAPGPFGLGFHPYFPHGATARLTTGTTGVWETSDDLLPVREAAAAPWVEGRAVRSERLLDHCHTGWDRDARIALGPGRPTLRLTASEALRWLHIYAPPDQDFFCVEPVSHAPNDVNMDEPPARGMRTLGPGETLAVWMRIALM